MKLNENKLYYDRRFLGKITKIYRVKKRNQIHHYV